MLSPDQEQRTILRTCRTAVAGAIVTVGATVGLVAFAPAASASTPAPVSSLSSSSCPTDMQSGEVDGCVTELQDLLNDQDGAGLAVDGDFGPATESAVESFQSAHSLSVDGVVGPDTKAALQPSSPAPPPSGGSSAIVQYATDIENGAAETGWSGGSVQYVWGGGHAGSTGPSTGTCVGDPNSLSCSDPSAVGIDCSGFARWVYDLAFGSDVLGPGGTTTQIGELTATSSPVPGDLVFFGSGGTPDHVGVYIGNDQMINAYETGTNVETDSLSRGGTLIGYYHYSG